MKTNKSSTLKKALAIITIPMLLLALFNSFIVYGARTTNLINPIFNTTLAKSLYSDLREDGIEKNDVVAVNTKDRNFAVGDIVVFYEYSSNIVLPDFNYIYMQDDVGKTDDDIFNLISNTKVGEKFSVGGYEYEKQEYVQNEKQEQTIKSKYSVNILKIKEIKIDIAGQLNFYFDGSRKQIPFNQNFIVGKVADVNSFVSSYLSFVSSDIGRIVLLFAPIGFAVIFAIFMFIDFLNTILLERKLLGRAVKFDDKYILKYDILRTLSFENKIFYFDVMPTKFKQNLLNSLFVENATIKGKEQKQKEKFLSCVSSYNFDNTQAFYQNLNLAFGKKSNGSFLKLKKRVDDNKHIVVKIEEYQNGITTGVDGQNVALNAGLQKTENAKNQNVANGKNEFDKVAAKELAKQEKLKQQQLAKQERQTVKKVAPVKIVAPQPKPPIKREESLAEKSAKVLQSLNKIENKNVDAKPVPPKMPQTNKNVALGNSIESKLKEIERLSKKDN